MKIGYFVALGLLALGTTPALAHDNDTSAELDHGKGGPALRDKLKDEFGADWKLKEQRGSFILTRNTYQAPGDKMRSEVDDKIKDAESSYKELPVKVQGQTARVSGKAKDCDDVVHGANDFAKIQGINKIVVRASCTTK